MRVFLILALLTPFLLAQQGPRDPWKRLQRYDTDGDGRVSREEFGGPERVFERLDADGDGVITKDEAQAMRRGRTGGAGNQGGMERMARGFDSDGDGVVSAEEWQAFFEKADENGDELLQAEELTAALRGTAIRDDAPKLGDPAPEASAVAAADGKRVDLSRVERTTVLVFGSWT